MDGQFKEDGIDDFCLPQLLSQPCPAQGWECDKRLAVGSPWSSQGQMSSAIGIAFSFLTKVLILLIGAKSSGRQFQRL